MALSDLQINTQEQALARFGKEWQKAGRIIFEQMIERGRIAQAVFDQYPGEFEYWCKHYAKMSRQGVNNYRNIYRHFQTLAPAAAAQFQARALYEVAGIAQEVERLGALAWALEFANGDLVDYQLAYLANPDKTPAYIREAFSARVMSKPQAYQLAVALNKAPAPLRAILEQYRVQWAAVATYVTDAYTARHVPAGEIPNRWQEIEAGGELAGQYAFVWFDEQDEYEVSISDASPQEVALYQKYRRWLRFEVIKAAQKAAELKLFIIGRLETRVRVENDVMAIPLPDDLKAALVNNQIDIEIEYRAKRKKDIEPDEQT